MADEYESLQRVSERQRAVAFVAGVLVGGGPVVALLDSFEQMKTPGFIGLMMGIVGGTLGALYVPRSLMDRVEGAVDRAITRRAAVPPGMADKE